MFKSTVFSLAHSISYLIYKKEKAMPTYQLQIKQIVDYSRCRIYRQFIRFLMEERSIRISGGSGRFCGTFDCHALQVRSLFGLLPGRFTTPRA